MNDVFLNILPSLDLHGNTSDMIEVLINEFINDNIKLRNYKVVIIHGKGNGILKNKCHDLLKRNKRVNNFYHDTFNMGCTIVELNKTLC